jgi:hypothetical protein
MTESSEELQTSYLLHNAVAPLIQDSKANQVLQLMVILTTNDCSYVISQIFKQIPPLAIKTCPKH